MRLRIITPRQVVLDTEVSQIFGQGSQGAFGLWAGDVDCLSDLVPGVLRYQPPGGPPRHAGLAAGILVKKGPVVSITTRSAYLSDDPAEAARRIRSDLRAAEDAERLERAALAMLEAEMQRQFRILDDPGADAARVALPGIREG
jgi:F-type H+-transporting ATPase subunit epsilon